MPVPPDTIPRIFLNPGRDKRVGAGHPWIYANEIRMDAEAVRERQHRRHHHGGNGGI